MSYEERLRRLALNDATFLRSCAGAEPDERAVLGDRELAVVRLAALIAVGGAVPSYGELTDAALDAGVTAAEIVDVLVQVMSVVGVPRVVDEAPKLASALGYDVEAAFEQRDRW